MKDLLVLNDQVLERVPQTLANIARHENVNPEDDSPEAVIEFDAICENCVLNSDTRPGAEQDGLNCSDILERNVTKCSNTQRDIPCIFVASKEDLLTGRKQVVARIQCEIDQQTFHIKKMEAAGYKMVGYRGVRSELIEQRDLLVSEAS